MAIANAINKQVIIGKQSAQGTVATAGGTSQKLRFLKFNQGEERENYKSAEHRPDRQVGDVNLGPRECNGTMNGELSPLTYKDFTASILRKAWATGGSVTSFERRCGRLDHRSSRDIHDYVGKFYHHRKIQGRRCG